jgi:hypothetical protein
MGRGERCRGQKNSVPSALCVLPLLVNKQQTNFLWFFPLKKVILRASEKHFSAAGIH